MKHTYIKLASAMLPNSSLFDIAKMANSLYDQNENQGERPFSGSDVALFGFADYLRKQSEETRACVVAYTSIEPVHRTLHITIQVLNEEPSPASVDEIKHLCWALRKLNLEHLVTEGLTKKTIKKYWKEPE